MGKANVFLDHDQNACKFYQDMSQSRDKCPNQNGSSRDAFGESY